MGSGMNKPGAFGKVRPVLVVVMSVVVVILVVVVGGKMVIESQLEKKQKSDQEYMYSVVTGTEGKKLIEDELRYADKNAFTSDGTIKSYKILTDTIERNPMGGIMVDIELNDKPDLNLTMIFEKSNSEGKLTVRPMSLSSDAFDLYKSLGFYQEDAVRDKDGE
ncbi:DUF1310 family protein [Alloscardovia theropitheci]|uniref:DUF1310 family protein n=1 Tax=Alloscardovia theropitheci TaxID=2496842 RepID=A0A4R0QYL0_9BIFI|nr:DUF1310 family protein [Alloscardovia theropitheci]TCD53566.1 DUF1310 family protein [Alloscardovia theropitheci]